MTLRKFLLQYGVLSDEVCLTFTFLGFHVEIFKPAEYILQLLSSEILEREFDYNYTDNCVDFGNVVPIDSIRCFIS